MAFRSFASAAAGASLWLLAAWARADCSTAQARADELPAQPSQADADRLLDVGVDFRTCGDEQRALKLFQKAHALDPSPRATAQLGMAERALRDYVQAERHLQSALKAADDPWISKNSKALTRALELARDHLGSVVIKSNVPGAVLFVNGAKVGELPMTAPIRVVAGESTFVAEADGYKPARLVRNIGARSNQEFTLHLTVDAPAPQQARKPTPQRAAPPPEPAPTPPAADTESAPGTGYRGWMIGAATAGVIGIGIGTAFGIRALSLKSERDDLCPDPTCADSRGTEADQQGRSAALVSTVAFSIGLTAAAIAVVLYVLEPPKPNGKMAWSQAAAGFRF